MLNLLKVVNRGNSLRMSANFEFGVIVHNEGTRLIIQFPDAVMFVSGSISLPFFRSISRLNSCECPA